MGKNHSQSTYSIMGQNPRGYIYKDTSPTPVTQGTLWKSDQKYCRSQRISVFTVRLYLLETSKVLFIKSHQYACPSVSRAKMTTNEQTKLEVEKSTRFQPYPENYRKLNNSGSVRGGPPQRSTSVGCPVSINHERIHKVTLYVMEGYI